MKNFNLAIYQNKLTSKEDIQLAIEEICQPVTSCSNTSSTAHLHIGNTSAAYPDPIAEMEGFSRLLWGVVPYLAGGGDYTSWETTLQGITNGTDPNHEEYWGTIHDYDQRSVEMAVYGFALALVPEKIYEPLAAEAKDNLVKWLSQINCKKVHDCNWLLFAVLVNIGLKTVGVPYDKERIDKNLDRIDEFYLADGWYSDGVNGHCDYYTSFAIHYYCLLYAKLMEKEDPERSVLYKERARLFARDFIYWFSKDGSALPYGRSLTYRFAQSSFWSAMVFAEVEEFTYGQMKGIILNNLRWWFTQPIFHKDGTLTIGYAYPNLVMAENYNSPGSPYWGMKIFLILALDDHHPFWQAEEQELPHLNNISVQKPAHLVIFRQEETGHVAAFNSGHPSTNDHTHTSAKYEKFVYSTSFGFSVPRAEWGLGQGAFDSMLAVSEGDHLYRVKRKNEDYEINGNIIYMKWKPWDDVVIRTWIVAGLPWHIRVHHLDSNRKLDVADGGFALGKTNEGFREEAVNEVKDAHSAFVKTQLGRSGIVDLTRKGNVALIHPNANTNILHTRTVIPTVKASLSKGHHILATAVYGEPGHDKPTDSYKEVPYLEMDGTKLTIYSADNRILFQQDLSESPSSENKGVLR
ncbi:DUF2264 domain-containing protein [Bacillus suaedae]|uniref:DUF2264 domain-containing protein n=1 Tax=Halalkalibacter suaedae TaxID=2822140 RepID=A0A940WWJ1_9BACI|nr:DUF2264 domain-containing protein [Bacillus suaedae]MBP3951902.1 DUF2264 domain-containing protein [Bacillus suaedae]